MRSAACLIGGNQWTGFFGAHHGRAGKFIYPNANYMDEYSTFKGGCNHVHICYEISGLLFLHTHTPNASPTISSFNFRSSSFMALLATVKSVGCEGSRSGDADRERCFR
jgi:hypothetical protein